VRLTERKCALDTLDRAYYDFCLETGRPYFGPVLRAKQGLPIRHNYMQMLVEAEHRLHPERALRILEVGSWAGGSAITWAEALRRCCGDRGRVVCMDPWKPYFDPEILGRTVSVYQEMKAALESGEILTLFLHNIAASGHADLVIPMRGASKEVLPLLANQAFDIVFIDGDHTHPSAQEDLEAAVRLIREGGVLCGDDLELALEEVDPAHHQDSLHLDYVLDPRADKRYHPGVTQAVAAICGAVSVWEGFWAMRWRGGQWEKVTLPAPEPHRQVTVPHLAGPDRATQAAFDAWLERAAHAAEARWTGERNEAAFGGPAGNAGASGVQGQAAYPRVGLRDQPRLSDEEIARARGLSSQIQALTARRSKTIQKRGLDPEFSLPAAHGKEVPDNALDEAYRHILEGNAQTLNTLRFSTQAFSGYPLRSLLLPATEPDIWVSRWQEMTRALPDAMIVRPPRMLGEIGWDLDGVIVNHDTVVYQERLSLLMEAGILDLLRYRERQGRPIRILEIGGGYGALAYCLKQRLPQATYTICDLPEALLFSALYLGLTSPQTPHLIYEGADASVLQTDTQGYRFVPNYLFGDLLASGQGYDLVINTLSMSEMSEHQVRTYGAGIGQLIGSEGVFFEQNQDNRHAGFNYCKEYLAGGFPCRVTLSGMTLPVMVGGIADVWSHTPLSALLQPAPPSEGEWKNFREETLRMCLQTTVEELSAQQISADQAIDRLLRALAVSPQIAPEVCAVGAMLCGNGAALASIRLFDGLIQAFPNEAIYHTRYGEALFQSGCVENARSEFLRASALAPDQAEIQNNLAVVCWQLGELHQALSYIEAAHRLDPNYAEATANLAAMRAALAAA